MRDHCGLDVGRFHLPTYADTDRGDAAAHLLRQVAVGVHQQHRIRTVRDVLTVRNVRARTLDRGLDEPGARRPEHQ
ncbi:hypothetical protein BH20ACT2_BH20ACT2_24580 [soil metagenome]